MSENIDIQAVPRNVLPITLVGKKYNIKPPKASFAIRMAKQAKKFDDDPSLMLETLEGWMSRAFSVKKGDYEAVLARLDDPEDELDVPHIAQLMEAVTEKQMGGNPTTS